MDQRYTQVAAYTCVDKKLSKHCKIHKTIIYFVLILGCLNDCYEY